MRLTVSPICIKTESIIELDRKLLTYKMQKLLIYKC